MGPKKVHYVLKSDTHIFFGKVQKISERNFVLK